MQLSPTAKPLATVTATASNENVLQVGPFRKDNGFSVESKYDLVRERGEQDVPLTGSSLEEVLRGAQQVVDSFDTDGLGTPAASKGEVVAAVVQAKDGSFELTAPGRILGLGTGNRTWWGNDRFEATMKVSDALDEVRAIVANGLEPVIIGADGTGTATTVID